MAGCGCKPPWRQYRSIRRYPCLKAGSRRLTAHSRRRRQEGQLVGVAFEKDGIEPVLIIVRDMPERIAEPLVERFAEALSWKFISDELHQRVCEFYLVLGGTPLRCGEVIGFERGRRERANDC